jgi:AcrR family transcriptional regulator
MSDQALGRRARKKLANRESLREAGLRLFFEKGYAATSVRDITEVADFAPRTFYQYFETKEDLLLVEVRDLLAEAEEVLERCPPELSAMECHFRVSDELEPRWSTPSGALSTKYRRMYQLGISEPDVEARFHLVVNQHVERVSIFFAQRLGIDPSALDVQLLARLSGVAFTTSLAVAARSEEPVDVFQLREQALLKLGQGLDPEATERRQKQIEHQS